MMDPALAFIMVRVAALTVLKQDFKLTLITSSQASSVILIKRLSRVIPALLIKISSPPNSVTTALTSSSAAAKLEASERYPLALIPKAANSSSNA